VGFVPITVTADQLREWLGQQTPAPAPERVPARAPKAATSPSPSRPRRPSPDAPPARPIPLAIARSLAEQAGVEALRRSVPLAGVVWASRCDGIRLRMVRGLLGRAALWVYAAEGRVHAGWLLAGDTWRWRATLDAATGQVLEAEVKVRRR
jgi:hypothetical protein